MLIATAAALAQNYPAPKEGAWVARDFKFHTGEVMPEVKLAYTTVGDPSGEPVLLLHGTGGSGAGMLTPAFAGELFGPGQALDATQVFHHPAGRGRPRQIVEALGRPAGEVPALQLRRHGAGAIPAGDRGARPKRLRLVLGNSMGGMHVWMWGVAYPDFIDALVPMASQPTEMSSRNWMMRRLIIDGIRNDPDWKGGDYTTQPQAFRAANVFYGIATNGGTLAYQKQAPTREAGRQAARAALAQATKADANDFLYPWNSSRDYNAAPGLDRITAHAARHQLRRRRAQPARDRADGARAQAGEERQAAADPGQRRDARPRADRHGEVLQAATGGFLATVPKRGM